MEGCNENNKNNNNKNKYAVIINEVVYYPKLNKKWKEYQTRRNKRMEAAGLEPIPVIRFHDLRHEYGR